MDGKAEDATSTTVEATEAVLKALNVAAVSMNAAAKSMNAAVSKYKAAIAEGADHHKKVQQQVSNEEDLLVNLSNSGCISLVLVLLLPPKAEAIENSRMRNGEEGADLLIK